MERYQNEGYVSPENVTIDHLKFMTGNFFILFWNISFSHWVLYQKFWSRMVISWPKIIITKNQLIAGRIIGHCHYAVSHWTFDIFLIEILFHCFWRFQNWPLDSQIMKSRNNIETWPENPFSWQARKLLPDDIHSFISLISLSFGPSTSRGSD